VRPVTPHTTARDDRTAQPDRERLGPPLSLISAIAAFLALFVALAALVSSRDPGDSSAEAGFARDMSVHHAQAVEMAEIVRDKTESEEMRIMAADIALTQQAQIGQMQGWLDAWGLPATGTELPIAWMGHPMNGPMPGMATQEEINRLREMPPEVMDKQFLRLMIPHPPPGSETAESVDLVGLFTKATELVAAVACAVLWLRPYRSNHSVRVR